MKLRVLLGLIACNLVWSAHPVMFKVLLREFSAPETAVLRYGSALLAFVLAWWSLKFERPFALAASKSSFWSILFLGAITFCVAPVVQLIGLEQSRATDNSLITALEPLTAMLLAWIFLREKLGWVDWASVALALAGFILLSGLSPESLSVDSRSIGNLLMLAACVLEGGYSVLGRKMLAKYGLIPLFGSSLLLGVLALLISAVVLVRTGWVPSGFWERVSGISWTSLAAVVWIGPIGTCAAYFFWLSALKDAPVAGVALTLFIQPVLGAVWGRWFLGDRLDVTQSVGALLILFSVFLPVLILNLRRTAGGSR